MPSIDTFSIESANPDRFSRKNVYFLGTSTPREILTKLDFMLKNLSAYIASLLRRGCTVHWSDLNESEAQ